MAKKNEKKSINIKTIDYIGFLAALIYMQSVLTVAHHTSQWVHDGSTYTVGPPAIAALIIGLLIVAYSTYKNRWAFSTMNVITLTILATASIFWLSGLRTNFYF
jgi:hypothetical protein